MGMNADLVRRWFTEVWAPGGEHTVDQLLAPTAIGWMEGRVVTGTAEFKDARRQLLEIFPDLRLEVEDLVEDGNRVAVRWSVKATHGGHGLGVAPTGQPVSFRGMTWMELDNGQIVRGWDCWNVGGLILTLQATSAAPARTH